MILTVMKDDEKMIALGAPLNLAKSIMPDYPWKEVYIRLYDSKVIDESPDSVTRGIVISPIKFGEKFIKSSIVFKEEMLSIGRSFGLDKAMFLIRPGENDDEQNDNPQKVGEAQDDT